MGLGKWAKNEWAEAKEAGREIWHFCRNHDWKKTARTSVKRKYWVWWFFAIVLAVAVALLSIYRDTIVEKFEPHKDQIIDFPASWVFPILILIILSFPPLGGHEVVILVIGLIWGVWIGFAITCAGTFIGEVLCFYLFKYFLTEKAAAVERKSIFYACIARLMRHGGLWIIIVVRFSAVPGHVVTAIQSTVGMSVWIYSIAVIVSLPKQLAIVYIGAGFGETNGKQSKISLIVFFVTCLATVLALYIVYMRARKLYPEVLRDMEEYNNSKDSLAHPSDAEASLEGRPDARPSLSGRGSTDRPLRRRDSLVEAAYEGDPGTSYVAPPNRGHGAHPMVRTDTGGTWRSEMDEHEYREGEQGAWQDGASPGRGYTTLQGESTASFSHLPLASESEVGVAPRSGPGSGAGSSSGRTAPPSYVTYAPPSSSQTHLGASPYSDPFGNPSQASSIDLPLAPPPPSSSRPGAGAYGAAPYSPNSGAPRHVPLQAPPGAQGLSIPYAAPGGGAGAGSRPTSVGGTEIMTGVGAGGRSPNGPAQQGGGQYGAMERR
ncbi:hypothetical protein JCM10207_001924 [Rhodosporidiobolus poonsookiae]